MNWMGTILDILALIILAVITIIIGSYITHCVISFLMSIKSIEVIFFLSVLLGMSFVWSCKRIIYNALDDEICVLGVPSNDKKFNFSNKKSILY